MATKTKAQQNAYARKYYQKNPKYRKEKIEDRKKDAKAHREEENKYSKKYYWKNPKYRKYKIKYAKNYNRSHK